MIEFDVPANEPIRISGGVPPASENEVISDGYGGIDSAREEYILSFK